MNLEPKILFLDILTDDRKLRNNIHKKIYGGKTYSEIMRKAFGFKKRSWFFADGANGIFPKNIGKFDGVVIGGSLADPVRGNIRPWMKKNYAFIRKIAKTGMPVLGICGGLQFTVSALGSEVIFNPKGKEFGSGEFIMAAIGKKDPIFSGLPGKFTVQLSHKCMMSGLKKGWKILGSSKLCFPQAIAVGKNIRLLQFHPEMSVSQLNAFAKFKSEKHNLPVRNASAYGKRILKNFIRNFVLPYRKGKNRV